MDIKPSLQILGWYIKGTGQKSTKRVNLFITCSAFCPGPPNRDQTMACIHVNCHDGTPCVACLQVFRQNTQKSECVYRRSPTKSTIGNPNKNLRVYMASDANWLTDLKNCHTQICADKFVAVETNYNISELCVMISRLLKTKNNCLRYI